MLRHGLRREWPGKVDLLHMVDHLQHRAFPDQIGIAACGNLVEDNPTERDRRGY